MQFLTELYLGRVCLAGLTILCLCSAEGLFLVLWLQRIVTFLILVSRHGAVRQICHSQLR